MLEKASYTYKNTVIQKTGQPTHLAVICSVPDIPMERIIKRKPPRHNLLFHGVLCLERSERNGYKNESIPVWKVEYGFSCMVFGTFDEAMAFCRGKFTDLDGREV